MRDFIGIDTLTNYFRNDQALKRDALIFSKIGVPFVNVGLGAVHTGMAKLPNTFSRLQVPFKEMVSELEWLLESGIIFEPQHQFNDPRLSSNSEFQIYEQQLAQSFATIKDYWETGGAKQYTKFVRLALRNRISSRSEIHPDVVNFIEQISGLSEVTARLFAVQLREIDRMDAYPILGNYIVDTPCTTSWGASFTERISSHALPLVNLTRPATDS